MTVIPFRAEDRDTSGELAPIDLTRLAIEITTLENERKALEAQLRLTQSAMCSCDSALRWRKEQVDRIFEKYGKP
jgi:hypothetical protein